jgi:hypothetical protein
MIHPDAWQAIVIMRAELDKANEQLATVNQSYAEAAEAWRNNAVELAKERDAALAEVERVKAIEKAAEALRKCWVDGTFTTMWMSHMATLRSALDARSPDTTEVDHE